MNRRDNRVRVTRLQQDVMRDFIKKNPTMAMGHVRTIEGRRKSAALWNELSIIMNACVGGISKTGKQWCKYFHDYKSKVKTKGRAQKRRSLAIGEESPPPEDIDINSLFERPSKFDPRSEINKMEKRLNTYIVVCDEEEGTNDEQPGSPEQKEEVPSAKQEDEDDEESAPPPASSRGSVRGKKILQQPSVRIQSQIEESRTILRNIESSRVKAELTTASAMMGIKDTLNKMVMLDNQNWSRFLTLQDRQTDALARQASAIESLAAAALKVAAAAERRAAVEEQRLACEEKRDRSNGKDAS